MASAHRKSEVVQSARFDRYNIHLDSELLAEHSERLPHTMRLIEVILYRCGMEDNSPSGIESLQGCRYGTLHVYRPDIACHDG
jgi:hypothetical protein